MTYRVKILSIVLLAVVAGGLIYLRVLGRRMLIQPSSARSEEIARAKLSEAALQPTSPQEIATLYFPSLEQGTVQPENRPISWAPSDTDRIRQVILALAEGSRNGLSRTLPATTALRGVFLTTDGTAYLDFSSQTVAEIRPGIASECLTVEAIVKSIAASVPKVKKVWILVEGQMVDSLNGHADVSNQLSPDLTPNATNP